MIKTLKSKNKALEIVPVGALLSLLMILYVLALRALFHFSILHGDDLMIVFSAGIVNVLCLKMLTAL